MKMNSRFIQMQFRKILARHCLEQEDKILHNNKFYIYIYLSFKTCYTVFKIMTNTITNNLFNFNFICLGQCATVNNGLCIRTRNKICTMYIILYVLFTPVVKTMLFKYFNITL